MYIISDTSKCCCFVIHDVLFESSDIKFYKHNTQFDVYLLSKISIEFAGIRKVMLVEKLALSICFVPYFVTSFYFRKLT